jgi:hypothetical protein
MIRTWRNRLKQICQDQGGMEALQTVCICAIAATVMIGAAKMGTEGKKWMNKNWEAMQTESDKGLKETLQDAASDAVGKGFDAAKDKGNEILDDVKGGLGL